MLDDAKNFMNGKMGLDVDRLSWRSEEQVTVADVSEVSTFYKIFDLKKYKISPRWIRPQQLKLSLKSKILLRRLSKRKNRKLTKLKKITIQTG